MTLPVNEPRNILRRVNRARNFPENTCTASRHVQLAAESLLIYGDYSMGDDPEHLAGSMLSVLESLFKARTKLAKLGVKR